MAMTVFARRSRVDSSGGGRQNFMENSNVLGGGGVVGGAGEITDRCRLIVRARCDRIPCGRDTHEKYARVYITQKTTVVGFFEFSRRNE